MSAPQRRSSALPSWAAAVPPWAGPAALGVALGAAVLAVGHSPGLGLALVTAALIVAGCAAAPAPAYGPAAAAVALALTPFVRDASWVVALALLGALVLGALAVARAQTWRAVTLAPVRWLAATGPGALLVAALAAERAAGRWGRAVPAARGVALATALVVVFGALFSSSDAAFAEMVGDATDVLPDVGDAWAARLLVALAATGAAGAFLWIGHAPAAAEAKGPRRRLQRSDWLIALLALDALFAAFVGLQLTALFGGHEHVARSAGLTYSEYAREGFGELVVVAALTLAVVAAARRWARDELLLRALLGVLCLCTLVVLASAHRRLGLYVDAYGLTRLRLLAQAEVLWLGGLFALVLAAGTRVRSPWRPRAAVALSALAAIAFVAADPDRRIAAQNVERYLESGRVDEAYLSDLSADAAPELVRVCITEDLRARLREPDGAAAYNLARRRAREVLAEMPRECAR